MNVAYFTDVEGQWTKLQGFVDGNPWVRWNRARGLEVAPGARLVFGGDAVDRGDAARRIVAVLLDVKRRQPDQVVLLAGNRDINKLRLLTELSGEPPTQAPAETKGDGPALLHWIFQKTMGAPHAFTHRTRELEAEGAVASDEAVVDSFVQDVRPGGSLIEYLSLCQLAHREDDTLFVHGGVTEQSLGQVPGFSALPASEVDAWVSRLNAFYRAQLAAFHDRRPRGYADLIAYQAPVPQTKQNQASVVYGRLTDAVGNPTLPSAEVIANLRHAGVTRVVLGHTPSGDCPSVVRDGAGFELVLADNSYAPVEYGARVLLGEQPHIAGYTRIGDATLPVCTPLGAEPASALGLRDATGRLLKARLQNGDYLAFRSFAGYRNEQSAIPDEQLQRPLHPAWA